MGCDDIVWNIQEYLPISPCDWDVSFKPWHFDTKVEGYQHMEFKADNFSFLIHNQEPLIITSAENHKADSH